MKENELWKDVLEHNDLWAKIIDTVLDHAELMNLPIKKGYCPTFSLAVRDLCECKRALEDLVE